MTRYVNSPEEMSNHLAFLQTDLSDPDFHAVDAGERAADPRRLSNALDEAVTAGELVPCDTARLARAVDALAGGSLIGWAVYRQGKAEAWVRDDLHTLLEPYRRKARTRLSRRSARTASIRARRRRVVQTRPRAARGLSRSSLSSGALTM